MADTTRQDWPDIHDWAIREEETLTALGHGTENLVLSPQSCRDMARWLRRLRQQAEAADTQIAPARVPNGYSAWETLLPDRDVDPDLAVAILLRHVVNWGEARVEPAKVAGILAREAARVAPT